MIKFKSGAMLLFGLNQKNIPIVGILHRLLGEFLILSALK